MAASAGPDIVEDGLVLYLDAGNLDGFPGGEPTTNLISDPLALNGNPSPVSYNYEAPSTRVSQGLTSEMTDISSYWLKAVKNSSTNGRVLFLGLSGLTVGVDYCFSLYAYTDDTDISSIRCTSDNVANSPLISSQNYNTSSRGTVQRIHCIFRSTSGGETIGVRVGSSDPVGATIYLTGLQVEQKSYPTPLVEGSRTTWKDLSGNGNDGTLTNGPTFSGDNVGGISFDGSNDEVICTNNPSVQITTGSIIAWFNANSGNSNVNGIIAKQRAWGLFVYNNTLQAFDWGNNTWRATGITVGNNNWNHVVMTFTETIGTPSNNAIIYLNGDSVLTTTIKHLDHSSTVQVGEANFSQHFGGKISQALVYNRVLSPAEVLQNYNATKSRFYDI